jgi:hypothetical protein
MTARHVKRAAVVDVTEGVLHMADVVFIAVMVAFFALALAFVHACDRIIGPETETVGTSEATEPEQAAA